MPAFPHIRVVEVDVDFGRVQALRGVSLDVSRGEQLAFVGPSGAGKTTLLRVLNGSQRVSRGSVAVAGVALAAASPRTLRGVQRDIGFVHQSLSLVPNLSVLQNVLAGALGRKGLWASLRNFLLPARSEVERVHGLLERVGIGDKLFERTDRLSGGQQQRVAIARAMFQEGSLMLADEPVSSVDPERARDTVALLTSLCREQGLTLCVSLHNLRLAQTYFSRLVGLRQGRIVFDRAPEGLAEEHIQKLYRLGASGRRAWS